MLNLGSSKVSRSPRQIINRSVQSLTAFSCELYIESFRIAHRGYVYFLWVSNNTQIHSLRYESTGKTIQVKETLTITVRVATRNGREAPLNTYLKLMAESGEELDECELLINSLAMKYQEMEVPMDRGLVVLRGRRKPMNVSEDESVNVNYRGGLYRSRGGRMVQERSQVVASEYESLQEELSRVKKELQDEVYLNNKLKNDREVLLATKQELQLQIETMIMQVTKEISILREHYNSRMSIREHCYEEEIEDLINMFNSQAEQSKKVVEMVLRQKVKLEEEMKPMVERVKRGEQMLQQNGERFGQLEREKESIQMYLSQAELNLQSKDKFIDLLSGEKQELKDEVGHLKGQIADLQGELRKYQDALKDRDANIGKLTDRNHELQGQLQAQVVQIHELEEGLHHGQEKQEGLTRENGLLQRQLAMMEEEKKALNEQIDSLRAKLQEFEYEMEFNENVLAQLKKQKTEKEEELYMQIDGLQGVFAKKMDDIIKSYQQEREDLQRNYNSLQLQKEEMQKKVAELEGHVRVSSIKVQQKAPELHSLNTQIKGEDKGQLASTLQHENERLKQEIQALRNEIDLMNERRDSSSPTMKRQSSVKFPRKEMEAEMAKLEEEIKRLNSQLNEALREIDRLREERGRLENELRGKGDRSIKNSKVNRDNSPEREKSQKSLITKIDRPLSAQQANEIVMRKQREIGELRRRVEQLENLYHRIQNTIELIVLKYPQVDLEQLEPAKLQICDSEQEEERIINGLASNNNGAAPGSNAGGNAGGNAAVVGGGNNEKKGKVVSKRGSFAEAIVEREEDLHSNPSMKYVPQKRRYEPLSEKRIGQPVDYQNGVLRKQSLAAVTIEVPRSPTMKREHSISYDPSERSGASYVKVSHSKKIRDLQKQIEELLQREKGYKAKIEDYLKNITQLNKEVESMKAAIRNYGSENSMKDKASEVKSKENKESQVFIDDERLKNYVNQCRVKEEEIQKLIARVAELDEALRVQRAEAEKKIIFLQSKINDGSKRDEDSHRKIESLGEIIRQLQKDSQQLEQKMRKERQSAQQLRLSVKQLNMHLQNAQNELKKLRHLNENLEEKVQKMSGSELIIKQLNREIEEQSKRGLEQTRAVNHLKLEKDSTEEELRLLKKRQNDQARIAVEWEEKAASLERTLEEAKRKENKLKREVEQSQEETRRTKLQMKKVEEELQILASSQTGWQVERRKHIDEISSLQDLLSRKDYEYNKLSKEIEKWRLRAEEKDEVKMGRKSEMREEIDRLESELIRKEKKVLEETEENKLLRSRLELLQKENKRIMQQRSQTYGEKLKQYVEEMGSIKKLLQQYQNENSRLKVDNNQLYEQGELIRINYDKLQNKYDDSIEREENILNDLQSYIAEVNTLKDRLALAHSELDQAETAYVNLRKEADEDKLFIRKINDRNDGTERNLERAQVEIRELRVRVSEYETNQEINGKMGERYKLADRRKSQLEEELRRLKSEYDNLVSVFIFKREDLEKAVGETRNQERRLKEEELQKLNAECSKLIATKTQRLEQEVLEVYQENGRLRNEIQILQEENGRFKGKIIELQSAFDRLSALQNEYDALRLSSDELKEELRKRQQKLTKTEISVEGLQSECNMKERELNSLRGKQAESEKMIGKLNDDVLRLKSIERELQGDLNELKSRKNKEKEEEVSLVRQRDQQQFQQYEMKINGLEVELQRSREREARMAEENSAKMKILQRKMDQMEEALKEKEKAIENHYQAALQELQSSLLRISQELQQKMSRIQELNEAIILLEGENKDLSREMQESRYLYDHERQTMQAELAKLKAKMKQAQSAYALNIRTLQQQISKNQAKNNVANSRLKGSDTEQRVAKRYEQKLKSKERKIEELKENMYVLQETLVKLKKKDTVYENGNVEFERMKLAYGELERERKAMEGRMQEEIAKQGDLMKELKRQILALKEEEDRLKLATEERILEMESMGSELKTVRELYQELQKELERRKHTLTNHLQEESSLMMQLRVQEDRVIELEEKLAEVTKQSREWETDSKRKSIELRRYIEQIEELTQSEQTHRQQNVTLTQQLNLASKSLQQLTAFSQSTKNELRQTKNELTRLKKNQQDLRISYINGQQTIASLQRANEQLSHLYLSSQQSSRKYNLLNGQCLEQFGCQLDELLSKYAMESQEQEGQIAQMMEEIEELKFLNERKLLDYDEIKKEHFELQLKLEDFQIAGEQVDALRKICDRLEEEKKSTAFREEVLRMQLENLANSSPELRMRIDAILVNPHTPSYGSFSFY